MSLLLEISFAKLYDRARSIIAAGVYNQRRLRVQRDVQNELTHLDEEVVEIVAALICAAHDEWSLPFNDIVDIEEAADQLKHGPETDLPARLRDIAQRAKANDRS